MSGRAVRVRSGALAVAVMLTACADAPSTTDETTTVDTTAAATSEVQDLTLGNDTRERSRAAALDVRASGCGPRENFGTATVIDENLAVTAAHVVAGTSDVRVIDSDGTNTTAAVVLFDSDLDVAVLRTTDTVGAPVALRAEVRADDRGVITLIRQVGGEMTIDQEDVTVLRTVNVETTDIYLEGDVVRPGFEVSGTIDPGDSGSLVTFPDGAAGLIWARSTEREARAWAVRLPDTVTDDEARRRLIEPVDVGRCVS